MVSGYFLGKLCDLGPAGFPSRTPACRHTGGFPLSSLRCVAAIVAGLPLSSHFNPQKAVLNTQSRSFPQQFIQSLASFAVTVSTRITTVRPKP